MINSDNYYEDNKNNNNEDNDNDNDDNSDCNKDNDDNNNTDDNDGDNGDENNDGRVGAVVRALAFHQYGPGSISALGVKCGLSLLVLFSAMRGFSPGTPVFPSHQKPTFDLIRFVENNCK